LHFVDGEALSRRSESPNSVDRQMSLEGLFDVILGEHHGVDVPSEYHEEFNGNVFASRSASHHFTHFISERLAAFRMRFYHIFYSTR
jgi:hypothetical protein